MFFISFRIKSSKRIQELIHYHFIATLILIITPYLIDPFTDDSITQEEFIVVIDAGHGGRDSGAVGFASFEKNITLDISKRLMKILNGTPANIKVILSRSSDVFIPLSDRVKLANDNNADLFLSIHCNALMQTPSSIYGSESYILGVHESEEHFKVAQRENDVIRMEEAYKTSYGDFDPDSDEAYIMLSMFQSAHRKNSLQFAKNIEYQMVHAAKRKSRGVKQAGFVVLREAKMPAVLVETGFLSNVSEEKYLRSETGRQKIAEALSKAIIDYLVKQKNTPIDPIINHDTSKLADILKIDTSSVSEIIENNKIAIENTQAVFRVQLASADKPFDLKRKPFSALNDLEVLFLDNRYKCCSSAISSYPEALKALRFFRSKGFDDAFLIAVKDGIKMNIKDVVPR